MAACAAPNQSRTGEFLQKYGSIHEGMTKADVIKTLGPPENMLKLADLRWKYEYVSAPDHWVTLTLAVHFAANDCVETTKLLQADGRLSTVVNSSANGDLHNFRQEVQTAGRSQ